MKLEQKVALVTGGTRGIGRATAALFAAEGARVFITGRNKDEVASVASQLGPSVTGVTGDATNHKDLDALFQTIGNEAGRLDVVFPNVGAVGQAPLGAITEDLYNQVFSTNILGTILTVQGALPLMKGGGSIILNAGILGIKGWPAVSIMAASKAAVRSFARSWSADLKGQGIRVNAVSPGPIDTPGLRDSLGSGPQVGEVLSYFVQSIPLGRIGLPEDIAKAVLFLASDDSSFITGAELFVDGGMAQV
ncbi:MULTISPECIES: SDR family oxidoreductase [unclassified Rhizobium]|uniref:SDR family NAD(P)-dependent oxidoreductase n=1 Tax=unclassified Rhizobium TaxID=2613769 RepID=UPI00161781BC|nr:MULTISPECIES: SDR family oxidoreductase [unclassified Rhizobium]MBB3386222.1 NAD(P)-dependent dehydrogenase (short-subunit alcohol dehydrogenase family) [Rhizobium sp. BK098]MBB3571909.1 NAD(P)-dependent dehydrogenase (short-subunit alcohol dehydrogenase family) [Rhizobium sp. BK491]MBB3617926.1 NAD(P)-dependent dehydrogenase (short-subunit alcohol dehydrogenase family) [Rhizobium sp. BK609]MBB3683621.1 NAD(P)-dependent dehydrogenase (short-subunit alcohol dehydrogenase family) [Rhizobium sp